MKAVKNPIKRKYRKIANAKEGALPGSLSQELLRFMAFHSSRRLSKNLRTMLIEFLMHEGALQAVYLKDLLYDLEGLFIFLDAMELAAESMDMQEAGR